MMQIKHLENDPAVQREGRGGSSLPQSVPYRWGLLFPRSWMLFPLPSLFHPTQQLTKWVSTSDYWVQAFIAACSLITHGSLCVWTRYFTYLWDCDVSTPIHSVQRSYPAIPFPSLSSHLSKSLVISCSLTMLCLFPYTRENFCYLPLRVWLISLNTVSSISIHLAANDMVSFFLAVW